MIIEYIRYRIPSDDGERFLAAWRDGIAIVRADPHNLSAEVSRCVDEPEVFIVRNTWDSADGHMSGFRGSPAFEPFMDLVGEWNPSIEELRHYEAVSS